LKQRASRCYTLLFEESLLTYHLIYTMLSSRIFLAALFLLFFFSGTSAWSTNQKVFRSSTPQRRKKDPTTPTASKPAHITAQNMLKNPGTPRVNEAPRKSRTKLSNSVLASCDTLPSFPTAHGLLSPETVMRMEELTDDGNRSPAVLSFLKTYRKEGPLSCLPMLSDPDVLPHLTEAMRDIVS
jgi:hypothetical protein